MTNWDDCGTVTSPTSCLINAESCCNDAMVEDSWAASEKSLFIVKFSNKDRERRDVLEPGISFDRCPPAFA